MNKDEFLNNLEMASSSVEVAGLIAEEVINNLPPVISKLALWCSFLPWFNERVLFSMFLSQGKFENFDLQDKNKDELLKEVRNESEAILSLPFVEKVDWGYSYHKATREGLIAKYKKENNQEIITGCNNAIIGLTSDWSNNNSATLLVFTLIVSGKIEEARKRSDALARRFRFQKNLTSIYGLANIIVEAEKIIPSKEKVRGLKFEIQYIQCLINNSEFKTALEELEVLIRDYPDTTKFLSLKSTVLTGLGEYDEAISALNQLIVLEKDETEATWDRLLRALIFNIQEKPEKALDDYLFGVKKIPENTFILGHLAMTYLLLNRYEECFQISSKVIELDRKISRNYYVRSLSSFIDKAGNKEMALSDISKAIEINPHKPAYFLLRARIFSHLQSFQDALEDLENAIKVCANEPGLLEPIMNLYLELSDAQSIKKILYSIIEENNNSSFIYQLALNSKNINQTDIAIVACKKIINNSNETDYWSSSYNGLGFLNLKQGNIEEAEYFLRKAIKLGFTNSLTFLNFGIVNWLRGNYDDAVKLFSTALDIGKTKGEFDELYEGWLEVILGSEATGIEKISSSFKAGFTQNDLDNIEVWTKAIMKNNDAPQGVAKIITILNNLENKSLPSMKEMAPIKFSQLLLEGG